MTDLQGRFDLMERISAALSAFTLDWFHRLGEVQVEEKGHADYVSRIDREAEALARDIIANAFPGDQIVGEEQGGSAANDCWVIDPIDGTANYLSGLPIWAVSIAYLQGGKPVIGIIAMPAIGFVVSGGTEFDLRVDGTLPPITNTAPVVFGVGRNPVWSAADRMACESGLEAKGYNIVSVGSCASALAMVAAGRLVGYVEHNIKLWDCAAGAVLCRVAGLASQIHPCGADFDVHIKAGPAAILSQLD
ncbi:inositol monophosphatase family protein [uncultured Tateyamaria sp.]|uniref:inositol monophosphatase family protein n=1 Tax=uncultured Tateyamaria sp. TaxID=455651 RepID=UPI002622414E|nr:inositol monophosphatase family protein [uncultured Tateyamaria sp.]